MTHVTIMGYVNSGHQQITISNRGAGSSPGSSAIDGDEFANDIVIADGQCGPFTFELAVLRNGPDGTLSDDVIPLPDNGGTFDHNVRTEDTSLIDHHFIANYRIGSDLNPFFESSTGRNDRSGMNAEGLTLAHECYGPPGRLALSTNENMICASATRLPSTSASPFNFPNLFLLCVRCISRRN